MIDVDRARADTPGSQSRTHLDNARASLMPLPVLAAMQEHLELEAQVGSAEAAEQQADAIERTYRSAAALVNADPGEITIYSGGALDLMAQAEPHVVDVSRAIGRTPIDVQSLDQPAVVASAGSYLRGPAGAGILVLRGGRRARVNPSPAVVLGLGRAIEYAERMGASPQSRRASTRSQRHCDPTWTPSPASPRGRSKASSSSRLRPATLVTWPGRCASAGSPSASTATVSACRPTTSTPSTSSSSWRRRFGTCSRCYERRRIERCSSAVALKQRRSTACSWEPATVAAASS